MSGIIALFQHFQPVRARKDCLALFCFVVVVVVVVCVCVCVCVCVFCLFVLLLTQALKKTKSIEAELNPQKRVCGC